MGMGLGEGEAVRARRRGIKKGRRRSGTTMTIRDRLVSGRSLIGESRVCGKSVGSGSLQDDHDGICCRTTIPWGGGRKKGNKKRRPQAVG